MAQPYVGEIRMVGFNFPPNGWMLCDGQLLPISEYETLFNLIGTTYGGDGQSTFALPDLRGRVPMHFGNNFIQAETGGVESVTLTTQQIPAHNHAFLCTINPASTTMPLNAMVALTEAATIRPYGTDNPNVALNAKAIGGVGGSQPHENMQPFLCVNFVISLFGIFPSQN